MPIKNHFIVTFPQKFRREPHPIFKRINVDDAIRVTAQEITHAIEKVHRLFGRTGYAAVYIEKEFTEFSSQYYNRIVDFDDFAKDNYWDPTRAETD